MDKSIRQLEWDSLFFEKKIATVVDIENFNQTDSDDYELLTNKVNASDYQLMHSFISNGFVIAEGELLFGKKLYPAIAPELVTKEIVAQTTDIPQLTKLANDSYLFSRFRAPWFTEEKKGAFYSKWIENAVLGLHDDICLVTKDNDQISGFISLKKNDKTLCIGLICVAPGYHGQGLASHLLSVAEAYALNKGCNVIRVATQMSNIPAAKLYIHNKYQLENTSYWFYKG